MPPKALPIVIASYSERWPVLFADERAAILAAIAPAEVEHIGSTSVPGLAAKPIIDIMIGVESLERAAACIPALAALGYEYVPELEAQMPERRYLRKVLIGVRTHQIHMVELGGAFWARHLLFRNYLRRHPQIAADYAALKRRLAAEFGADINGYTDAKTGFIRNVERLALQERDAPE